MIRLFSILILSLSFIGSANANSIKGAFGYELGQVVDDVTITQSGDDWFYAEKKFKPNKPLLGLNNYRITTTLKDKIVYEISASLFEKATNYDKCGSDSSDYSKILKALNPTLFLMLYMDNLEKMVTSKRY